MEQDQNPEIVIVDRKGNEHVFPAGTDPKMAASRVRAATERAGGGTAPGELGGKPYTGEESTPPVRTLGGFLGNIPGSATRFVSNTVDAFAGMFNPNPEKNSLAMVGRVMLGINDKLGITRSGHEAYADAVWGSLKDRYGSIDAIRKTAYEDPVGFAADVSALVTGAGGAVKATGALPKLASTLTAVGDASNPVRLVSGPAGTLARQAGITAADVTVRPMARLRRGQMTNREIAKTIVDNGLITSDRAGMMADRAFNESSRLAANSSAQMSTQALTSYPRTSARLSERVPANPGLYALDELQQAQRAELAPSLTAQELLAKGREMDRVSNETHRARDMGHEVNPVTSLANEEFGNNARVWLRENVPGIQASQDRSRRMTDAQRALSEAEDRPSDLTRKLALLAAGGGAASGEPIAGLGTSAAILALNSPKVGATVGTALNYAGKAGQYPAVTRGVLYETLLRDALLQKLRDAATQNQTPIR